MYQVLYACYKINKILAYMYIFQLTINVVCKDIQANLLKWNDFGHNITFLPRVHHGFGITFLTNHGVIKLTCCRQCFFHGTITWHCVISNQTGQLSLRQSQLKTLQKCFHHIYIKQQTDGLYN